MIFRLNELKGQLADRGKPVTWDEIATATGISKPTLLAISKGDARQIRMEYLDALAQFFDTDANGLMQAESVRLPLQLNIRPDRHGVPVRKVRT